MSLIILNRDQSRDIRNMLACTNDTFKTFSVYVDARTLDVKVEGKNKYTINGKPVELVFN